MEKVVKEKTLKDLWMKSYKRVNRKNYEICVRRLAEIGTTEYTKNHFKPEDVAYIRCMFKDYIIEYFLPLVEILVKGRKTWKQ